MFGKEKLQCQWNQREITQPKICFKHRFLFLYSIWTDVSLGMVEKSNAYIGRVFSFGRFTFFFSLEFVDSFMHKIRLHDEATQVFGAYFWCFFRRLLRCFTVVKLFALVAKRREENCNGRRFSWRKGLKITVFRTNNEGFATTHGSDALSIKTVVHLETSIASKQEVAEQLARVLNRDRKVFLCSCSYEFRWTNFVHTKSNSWRTWRIMNKFYMLLTAKRQFGFEFQPEHVCTGICRKTVFGGVSWLKLMISVLLINYRFFGLEVERFSKRELISKRQKPDFQYAFTVIACNVVKQNFSPKNNDNLE